MTTTAKYVHDDIVTVISTGQKGTVKGFRYEEEDGFNYRVLLTDEAGQEIDVAENDLKLVKIANDDETGFTIRYIS